MIKTHNNFDFMRLLLAVFVYFGHWNILTQFGSEHVFFNLHSHAVNLFFVFSGFLIFWSYENDQNKYHFFIKRFFRIFPLYFLLILVQTIFFIIYSDGTYLDNIKYFISNIIFLNFLAPTVGDIFANLEINAINGSLWTLKNEVVFYLMVPFLFIWYKKFGLKLFIFMYLLSVTYMFIIDFIDIDKLNVQYPAQLRLFLAGIIIYVLFDKLKEYNYYYLGLISLSLLVIFNNNEYFYFVLYPICISVLVLFLVYTIKKVKISFDFSYSFYIIHFPVIQLALYFDINPSNPLISFVVLFCIIILLSYLSEIYIEKYFINIGRSLIKKLRNNY